VPRNGSGTYSPPAGTAAVSLQPIGSAPYNAYVNDMSSEMTNSLPTTGVKAMGANLPMGGNKITNMADGSALSDGATMNNVALTHGKVLNRQIFSNAGTPTYTRTAGTTTIDVYLLGGCGAGGGAPATGAGVLSLGSGGGTGALTVAIGIAAPATAAVVIGAGGVGASGAGGGNGGSSSFNGTITAPGGGGGNIAGPTTGIFVAQPGGAAGAGAGGTFNFPGITGGYAITSSSGIGVAAGALIYALGLIRHAGPGSANGASQPAITGATGDPGLCVVVEYS
jgi:hypothetical protein